MLMVAVGGCRYFNDRLEVFTGLDVCLAPYKDKETIVIMSGHCTGVDRLAEEYAKKHHYKLMLFPANWEKYGKAAGPKRNRKMVEKADLVIAFWDLMSKGTGSFVEYARKMKKTLRIIEII